MLDSAKLQKLIQKILLSDLTGLDLNSYIRFCATISSAYLMTRRASGKLNPEYLQADDQKLYELALSSIADLFERDNSGSYVRLIQYYEPLQQQIQEQEDEVLFMTRRLVVAHTKQSLIKAMMQSDPVGYKIYRNLALVPKRDPRVILQSHGDKELFFFSDSDHSNSFPEDFRPELPEIGFEQAARLLSDVISEQASIPAITRLFLEKLGEEEDVRAFIGRTILFKLLKSTNGMPLISLDNLVGDISGNSRILLDATEQDQFRYLEIAKGIIRSEIQWRYIEKSKIVRSEADEYLIILDQYLADLFQDGVAGKLPEYRGQSEFANLDDDAWKIHRGRLEYLVKLVRDKMKLQYTSEFLSSSPVSIEGNDE